MWAWLVACGPESPTGGSPTTPPPAETADTGTSPDPTATTGHTGASTADTAVDPDVDLDLFPRDRVLEVVIELAPADWDALRFQDRPIVEMFTGDECLAEPFESPYVEFPAVVTLDGVVLPDVNVRKKGFMGSASAERPSLKLDTNDLVPGRDVGGADRITLNNGLQDPSRIRTCLASEALLRLGVPAARCALAHVTVNGADLGLYAHVEDVEEGVLPAFSLDGGQLYEGTMSDFVDGFVHTFEPETDETDPDLALPLRLVAALEAPDDELEEALDGLVDLPAVYRFWAAEALLAHYDGYTAHRNNFYAAWPPEHGLVLIPSGLEATFGWDASVPEPEGTPAIQTDATLTWRLQAAPATRAAFQREVEATLALWDEAALEVEIDRLAALAAPYVEAAVLDEHTAAVRAFVAGREAEVREAAAALDDPTPPLDTLPCFAPAGPVSLTFDTTFDTLGDPGERTGTSTTTTDDGTFAGGAIVGFRGDFVVLEVHGRDGLRATTVTFPLATPLATSGQTRLPVGTMSDLASYERDDTGSSDGVRFAYLGGGVLVLDAFGTNPGDPVRGSFQGTLSAPPPF